MAFKMKNPGMGKLAKAAGSPHKFGIAGEMKGIDSASRGTKGMDTRSPAKKKQKYKVDTRGRDYFDEDQEKEYTKRIGRKGVRVNRDQQTVAGEDRYDTAKKAREATGLSIYQSGKNKKKQFGEEKFYDASPGSRMTKVKVKGGKTEGIRGPQHKHSGDSNIEDIKKIKAVQGKGRYRRSTKVKYDKEGNVKKVVNRAGRFGLKKGEGIKAGIGNFGNQDRIRRGKKALDEIAAKTTSGKIRGKAKRESGDKKA
jgi:hypothetical protein